MNVVRLDRRPLTPVCAKSTPLHAEIVKAINLTPEHIQAWQGIVAADSLLQNPFYTVGFTQAAALVHQHVYVAVFRQAGRIEGFLPYQFATMYHRLFGIAERVGREMSDYFGIIARESLHMNSAALLKLCKLNTLSFTHLDESQWRFGLTGGQSEVGLRIQLSGGDAAYWQQLTLQDKKLVHDTDRRERKLAALHGPLRFEFTAVKTSVELERLIVAKRQQYSRTSARDALGERWATELITALSQSHDSQCHGQLSVLFAGDTWVASHFGLRNGHILHYWFPAYNPGLKAFSPGRLLLKAIITAASDARITVIDRGSGDTPAKRDFANETHNYFRDLWYAPGAISLCYRAAKSLMWKISQR